MYSKFVALLLCVSIAFEVDAASPDDVWDPSSTWVFAIGLLEWEDPKFQDFPKENRQDEAFIDVMKSKGVASNRIVYLRDGQATTKRVADEFGRFVGRPAEGDTLILYYCGHGYNSSDHRQTFLASYDATDNQPGIRVGSFLVTIEKFFKGKNVIIAADHCCSGGIAESVKVLQKPHASYAVFCSAHVNSGSTGAWTFTENLVNGFRGEPFMDDNADGTVTIAEIAANTAEDMAFADNQMAQFAITASFPKRLIISKTTSLPKSTVGARLEIQSDGQWYRGYVTDVDEQRIRVHYFGFPKSDDEWVDSTRTRKLNSRTIPEGSKVKVLSSGEWYDASVIGVRLGLHHVKFDGWEREWNEWVPIDRIQPKRRLKK